MPLNRARKIALGLSASVMPAALLIPGVPSAWALAIFSLAYFGQQSWSTLVMILPTDMYPRNAIGAVAGLVGFGGAMGGVVFGQVVGTLLDRGFGYGVVFALDVKTGATIYGPERLPSGTYSASPILADGKIYVTTEEEGLTTVFRAGPKFEVLSSNSLLGDCSPYCLSTVAISDGQLFMRTSSYLWAVGQRRTAGN